MNYKVIFQKFLKGAASGALGAIGTLSVTGLTSKGAIVAALAIVGGAAFNSGFEAVHQAITGTVATRTNAA